MDSQRFDKLTRAIATGTSRRQLLKLIGGGTVAASVTAVGLRVAGDVAAQGTCVPGGESCSGVGAAGCCSGLCNTDGICYCTDPARPGVGCPCTSGTQDPCGDTTLLCCSAGEPGSEGVCTPDSVGCDPTGCDPIAEGCPCTTGTEAPCGDTTLVCCATTDTAGGAGVCTSASVGCDPTGCTEPAEGCPCTTGVESSCGTGGLVCCSTGGAPGAEGVCTTEQECISDVPNTGMGTTAGGNEWIAPIAVVAAGAALIGLKRREQTTEG